MAAVKRRLPILGIAALVATLAVLGALLLAQLPFGRSGTAGATGSSSSSARDRSAPTGSPAARPSGTASPDAGRSRLPALEVLTPTSSSSVKAESSGSPTSLPGLRAPAGVVQVALPARASSARGRLVSGYPHHVVPVPVRATVVSSGVSPAGHRLQGTVVATYPGTQAGLLRYYRHALRRAGLRAAAVPAVGGSTAYSFGAGTSSVTLTLGARAHGRVPFSLFLILPAAHG